MPGRCDAKCLDIWRIASMDPDASEKNVHAHTWVLCEKNTARLPATSVGVRFSWSEHLAADFFRNNISAFLKIVTSG